MNISLKHHPITRNDESLLKTTNVSKTRRKKCKIATHLNKESSRLLYTEIRQKGERLLLSLMPTHSSVSALGGLCHNTLTPAAPARLKQHVVMRCTVMEDHLQLWELLPHLPDPTLQNNKNKNLHLSRARQCPECSRHTY